MRAVLLKSFQFFKSRFNTKNSGTTIALPKVELDFARKGFNLLGASASLPLKASKLAIGNYLESLKINVLYSVVNKSFLF